MYACMYGICLFVCIYIFIWGFSDGLDSKESACNMRDLGFISRSERSLGKGSGNPL